MTIRVALHHRTAYRYDRLVSLSPQAIRLRPAPHCRTPIISYSQVVVPEKQFINWQQDPFGNFLARVVFPDPTREFQVDVDLVAEMTVINPFDFFLEPQANSVPFAYDESLKQQLLPYLLKTETSDILTDFVTNGPKYEGVTVDFLVAINQLVHHSVSYVIRLEPGVQSSAETLTKGSGSCRDSAWLLVQVLRHLGLAARFASGYLIQLTPDVKSLDGPVGVLQDFTDLHAWTEVYLPGAGWVGLDPTSGLFAGEGHIPLSATPDPTSAAPITGAVDECEVTFHHEMRVQRVLEDPRVTKPYRDDQWAAIEQLGTKVDERLSTGPKNLTMGGEPTFVAIDNRDAPEWNTDALGEHKRGLAGKLFCRLADRFAAKPLLHYGQGKWYPGESLPRWSLACYWRRDGSPVWNDPALIAEDNRDYGADESDAQDFIEALAELLGVSGEHIQAGYEDTWYYLWRERKLPVNVDPFRSKLSSEEERLRLAKIFERGLDHVVGYALPLRCHGRLSVSKRWETGPWFLRQERMYLIPGDSPMGYRMPLDSLPWELPSDIVTDYERDPMVERAWELEEIELPVQGLAEQNRLATNRLPATVETTQLVPQIAGVARQESTPRRTTGDSSGHYSNGNGQHPYRNGSNGHASDATDAKPPAVGESGGGLVRSALVIEPRHGMLHVFMPPVAHIEDYLHLVSVIESTADKLS
ncbi:MAG: transglutaminase family protein, partial [Planctomycetaceae bacterium]|nr:transglutaminase family protein [Planctomycetaceae bacterium]